MYPSFRIFSARAHQPLIKFLGKRSWPSALETPHPHLATVAGLKHQFAALTPTQPSTVSAASSRATFNYFWEIPERLRYSKARELGKVEMDAVMSGGASLCHS
ncbi:hypothetical protein AX15_003337 [Amanita polypyramis BW_CC]|nr:hypothetical protein AX15_003337 [Amanita polypyramis BW_CC]